MSRTRTVRTWIHVSIGTDVDRVLSPTDCHAADHIRRVLETFPGVYTGIGAFNVHEEFVSATIAGSVASLLDPALDSILAFAGSVGLLVILHNDVDVPSAKRGSPPTVLEQMHALVARHPFTQIIWAHVGVGRVVWPVTHHAAKLETLLRDPTLSNLSFDISWDEVAKYIADGNAGMAVTASLVNRHPDRFLIASDVVAPENARQYYRVIDIYRPFLDRLTPAARSQLLRGNYERLFGAARQRVRAWEAAHVRSAPDEP